MCRGDQDVVQRTAGEHRLHHRLSESVDSRARRRIAPGLERMMGRHQQMRRSRRSRPARRPSRPRTAPSVSRRDRAHAGGIEKTGFAPPATTTTSTWPSRIASNQRAFTASGGLSHFAGRILEEHHRLADIAGDRVEDHRPQGASADRRCRAIASAPSAWPNHAPSRLIVSTGTPVRCADALRIVIRDEAFSAARSTPHSARAIPG